MRVLRGFALADLIRSMHDTVFQLDVPAEVTCRLIERMAEIEFRLSRGCTDRIQLASLISAFIDARVSIEKIAPNDDDMETD